MTRTRETRNAAHLAVLLLSQPVFGQNSLDLEEADARDAAYEIMAAAEEQFECKLEEREMRHVGNEPEVRYVFYLKAKGEQCRAALVFASNMAAREDKILFRQVQPEDADPTDSPSSAPGDFFDEALLQDDQVLIHEVNPEIDDSSERSEKPK